MKKSIYLIIALGLLISCQSKLERSYYDNGNLKSEITYSSGHINGPAIFYYPDGTKQMECNYINDTLDGILIRYHKNGKKSHTENYIKGLREGKFVEYTFGGSILRINYYKNDTLDGPVKEFHFSGTKKLEGNYKDGLFDGKWIYYDDIGEVVGIGEFDKGLGQQKTWYDNGQLKHIINYKNNLKHGEENAYATNGDLIEGYLYENGELIESNSDK